jgi:hypothetical protein
MTGPEFSASDPTPDYAAQVATSDSDFGPDPSGASDESPSVFENLRKSKVKPPRTNGRAPRSTAETFGKLGTNKKARSPVRKLTSTDRDKIESLYTFGAMGLMSFRPKAATVMAESADKCADAWMELADQNDSVRRALLAIMEGGVWGKIFAAHLPILVALIPESAIPPMFRGVDVSQFGGSVPDVPPTGE